MRFSNFTLIPAICLTGLMSAPVSAQSTPVDPTTQMAVEQALYCWARGMDLTIAGETDAANEEWKDCYAHPDYTFRVLFRGQVIEGAATDGRAATNVQTATAFGYTGAQHYVSNVQTEANSDGTLTARALQKADHFGDGKAVETSWGILTVDFAQTNDGAWRAVSEVMDITQLLGSEALPAPAAMMADQ